jgi:hypothetical protein
MGPLLGTSAGVGTFAHSRVYELLVGDVADRVAADLDCTTLVVHGRESDRQGVFRPLRERPVY